MVTTVAASFYKGGDESLSTALLLPAELWERILFLLSPEDIAWSRLWSGYFNDLVLRSTVLQCIMQCRAEGVALPDDYPYADAFIRLEEMKSAGSSWKSAVGFDTVQKFQVLDTEEYDFNPDIDRLAGPYFLSPHRSKDHKDDPFPCLHIKRFSSDNGVEREWDIDRYLFCTYAVDPKQDLLLLFDAYQSSSSR